MKSELKLPSAAMLVIGNEILSGRTHECNSFFLAGKLTEIGVHLLEIRIVPDLSDDIIFATNELRAKHSYLFTSGGIGPTHDDITASSIAKAFKVEIGIREDARIILENYYLKTNQKLNAPRLRMARIPEGAILIENSVSAAPGFILSNVYVMAGVPKIFKAMVNSILPTLHGGKPILSVSVALNSVEGDIAIELSRIADKFGDVSIGSYPFNHNGVLGTNIVARHSDEMLLNSVKYELKKLQEGNFS